MGSYFTAYIEGSFKVVSKYLKVTYWKEIQKNGIETIKFLLKALNTQKEKEDWLIQILNELKGIFDNTSHDFEDPDNVLLAALDCIRDWVKEFDHFEYLSLNEFDGLFGKIQEIGEAVNYFMSEILNGLENSNPEYMHLAEKDIKNELENPNNIISTITEISGHFAEMYKEDFYPYAKAYFLPIFDNWFIGMLDYTDQIWVSLWFFSEWVDFWGMAFLSENKEFVMNIFKHIINSGFLGTTRPIIQNVWYALGWVAQHLSTKEYAPYSDIILNSILLVLNEDDWMEREKREASENAVSALLKICLFQKDNQTVTDKHVKIALNLLPLKTDLEESKTVSKLLIKAIAEHSINLFGEDNANCKEIYSALRRISDLHSNYPNTKLQDDELVQKINDLKLH
jgi:hypothetical protein